MVIRVATAAVLLSSRSCNLSDAFEDEFFKPKSSTSGPWVQQSSGAIWPKPAYQFASSNVLEVDPRKFEFEVVSLQIIEHNSHLITALLYAAE